MTSALPSGSADGTMAHLSPSASMTLSEIPTQSDGSTNVISTSYVDVDSTQAHFDRPGLTAESQLPFSIGVPSSSSWDETSDISQTTDTDSNSITDNTLSVSDVSPVQTMLPSWISASSDNPVTEYSSGSSSTQSSTPSLPQSISASKTNIISASNSNPSSTFIMSSTTPAVRLNPSSSKNVITTDSGPPLVPSMSKTVDKIPPTTKLIPQFPTKAYKTASATWLHQDSTRTVMTTSSVIAGISPRETTPYSVDTKKNETGYVENRSGYPNATILFIIVPVSVVVLLVLSAILIACVRRRKHTKKPNASQNPDLWVNTRSEIALVPTAASGIDTSTETVLGFKPGDIVCRVVYPFTAQLEGQMTLTEKELIKILEKADNGWWRGATQTGEQSGWFPGCYVEELKPGDVEDGILAQSKGKSRVSSFMLKKRERIRRRSATAVSPIDPNSDPSIPSISTSKTLPALNSAEINKFNDGRIFKALFSYHASSKGELSIEEGDIVRGWEKDRNGWMHGRKVISGEEGWFPAVYVDEVPSDTSSISGESTLSGPIMYEQLAPNKNRKSDQEWLGIEHRAIHPYMGKSETDLTFDAGDTIIIYETLDNGWWLGSHGEDVGWLPGSYLEILDMSKDDESGRSDVSSLLSSNDDRNKTLEDELSHMTSNQSLNSTLSDSKPKPKPARKAPPPPKLKPLKIPVREIGQHSTPSVTSELRNVILKTQSPVADPEKTIQENEDTKTGASVSNTPSSSKPKRPAPPPPPQRVVSQQSQLQSQPVSPDLESVSTTVASSSSSPLSESKLKPGEKPILPKRFAKPKVIRIPRQSSRLQNLAVNSRPSSRPAPPRPPPPKLTKNVRGNITGKVQSSNSVSGIYAKKIDSKVGKSPSNSVKNVNDDQINNSTANSTSRDVALPVTTRQRVLPVPPVTVPTKLSVPDPSPPSNKSDEPNFVENVNNLDKETLQSSATIEDSPKIYISDSPKILSKESDITNIPVSHTEEPQTSQEEDVTPYDPPPGTLLYPLEACPSLSSPVVPPVTFKEVPPKPLPVVPPVVPPAVPRMSPQRDVSPDKTPVTSSGDISPVDTSVDSPQAPVVMPQVSSTEDTSPTVTPLSPAVCTSPVGTPPVVTSVAPAVAIAPKDESTNVPQLSPELVTNESVEGINVSPASITPPAAISTVNIDMTSKPAPPPKPSRVPPPVLPKPKIKPKPTSPPVVIDIPPKESDDTVSDIDKETDRFSSSTDIPPPLRSDSVNVNTPHVEDLRVTEDDQQSSKINEDQMDSANNDVPLKGTREEDFNDQREDPGAKECNDSDINIVPGGYSRGGEESDSDDDLLQNGDITSNSSATYDSSSDKSDTVHLGTETGESDDNHLGSADNLDTVEKVTSNPDTLQNEDKTLDGQQSEEVTDGHLESDDHTGHPGENPHMFNGLAVYAIPNMDTKPDIVTGQEKQCVDDQTPQEPSGHQPDPVNGQLESSNGHSDTSHDRLERASSPIYARIESKPVPLPRTSPSPKVDRPPPARPPPPKSPPPKAHRLINQGDSSNKPKKKTLRRAVKTYVPQGKGELSFEEGSFIKEMSKAIGRPGWCIGMLADGTTGLYPISHVEDAVTTRQSNA